MIFAEINFHDHWRLRFGPGGIVPMGIKIGQEEIVLVGFSKTLLTPLTGELPPRSVVVVEEPGIAAKRDVPALASDHPAVARVVLWEYRRPAAMSDLLRAEPGLTAPDPHPA